MLENPAHGDLAYSLSKYYFGNIVATVVKELFRYDKATLATLKATHSTLKVDDIKKALLILVKYQLVDYVKTIKSCEYSIVPQRVFAFFRIPKFIQSISRREGHIAASALRILSEKGIISENSLVDTILKRHTNESRDHVSGMIRGLITRSFLAELQKNIFINIERFSREHRDELIVEAVSNFYSKQNNVKTICQAILDLSLDNTADDAVITAPVDLHSLHQEVKNKEFADKNSLERYIAKLATEVNYRFFVPCGNHPQRGPQYALNVGLVIDYLVKEHLCSVITTKYGPKCCRLFRILLQKGPLLLKQIEEIIMLPARDVREYSYMLNKEGLIRNRQVPKTPDNAPAKSVFIFSVEMYQVVNKVADLCCRSMHNLLIRYEYELSRNEPLLSRSKAVQQLIGPDGEKDEWNQYFNSHELSQLSWTERNLERILLARNQVDETLFICHIWLTLWRNMNESSNR